MPNSGTSDREARPITRLLCCCGRRIGIVAVLLGAIYLATRWLVPTPHERLAAFDAARAVPDEDNAALIYAELLQGESVPSSDLAIAVERIQAAVLDPMFVFESRMLDRRLRDLELAEGVSDPNVARAIGARPWRSAECPELRQWLNKQQDRIDKLQEAARKPFCHFAIGRTPGRMSLFDVPLGALRQNIFLLILAGNNDFGEGDIDAGLRKWQTLMLVGRHLCQQPSASYLLSGIACEAAAIHHLAEFVVESSPMDHQLHNLMLQYDDLHDKWESLRRDIDAVRDVYARLLQDERSRKFRAYMWLQRVWHGDKDWNEDRTRELYQRLLSERRGLRILIELRRFKNRTGRWAENLDQVTPSLPPEALIDPSSGGPYVYKPSGEGFSLYSIGPNRIDENGRHKWDGPDDWPIWPPRGWGY